MCLSLEERPHQNRGMPYLVSSFVKCSQQDQNHLVVFVFGLVLKCIHTAQCMPLIASDSCTNFVGVCAQCSDAETEPHAVAHGP